MGQSFKIGVDGGGTKTECILADAAGEVIAVGSPGTELEFAL